MANKTATLTIHLTPDQYKKLARMALKESRTLSGVVRCLVDKAKSP